MFQMSTSTFRFVITRSVSTLRFPNISTDSVVRSFGKKQCRVTLMEPNVSANTCKKDAISVANPSG